MAITQGNRARYLPVGLAEKVLGEGETLSFEENLRSVGYLSDLLEGLSMYVP